MPFDRDAFEQRVAQLEEIARKNPKGYNFRVGALAVLGYGYIFGVLAVCLALLGGLVWIAVYGHRVHAFTIKLGFLLLVFTFAIIKSLFVKFEAPTGRELVRADAPQLFEHVDEIRSKLNSPAPHHVLLTDDFNAAVAQVPRLGILGWQKNYLIVGMPLMSALTPEEFKSVIAHEFGHLSGNHSRFGGWIYRVQHTWEQVMMALGGEGTGDLVFGRFFAWYTPYFAAYSFALRRANEYVADRCAAEICGTKAAASGLTRGAVAGGFLTEKYWPEIFSRIGREATPPVGTFATMRHAFSATVEPARANMWLSEAVLRPADILDTHPSLPQRLEALGEKPHWEPLTGPTAADFYLGEKLPALTEELDTAWRLSVNDGWTNRHKELSEAREKLETFEEKARNGQLTDEEQWERADATEDLGEEERAFQLFQEYLATHENEARAHFAVGRILLKRGDDAGLVHIERAMELELEATGAGCELCESYLLQRGRTQESEKFRLRGRQFGELLEKAEEERSTLSLHDTFVQHGLSTEEVESLRTQLSMHEQVAAVYLVRKQLQYFPDNPIYIMGIEMVVKKFSIGDEDEKRAAAFQQIVNELVFPKTCRYLRLDSSSLSELKPKMDIVVGSKIYEKVNSK